MAGSPFRDEIWNTLTDAQKKRLMDQDGRRIDRGDDMPPNKAEKQANVWGNANDRRNERRDRMEGLVGVLSAFGANPYTGQGYGAFQPINHPSQFNLGGAIGAAYRNVQPVREENTDRLEAKYPSIAAVEAARYKAEADKVVAREQARAAVEAQKAKTGGLAAILQLLSQSGMFNANAQYGLGGFNTDYGAGVQPQGGSAWA